MELSVYKQISSYCDEFHTARDFEKVVAPKFPKVSTFTLENIFSQVYRRTMLKNYRKHTTFAMKKMYYKMCFERLEKEKGMTIVNMAKKFNVASCVIARIVIEMYIDRANPEAGKYRPTNAQTKKITSFLQDPLRLEHFTLGRAIRQAEIYDDQYGPVPDAIRRECGEAHERKLVTWCKKNNLAFITEEDMRDRGFDKTPDIKLEVPIAVDGFVVNWIESKASFGDRENHQEYMEKQLRPYRDRFGPGIVIYFFGYIDALDCQRHNGIAITDRLPKNIEKIDLALLEKKTDLKLPRAPRWDPSDSPEDKVF